MDLSNREELLSPHIRERLQVVGEEHNRTERERTAQANYLRTYRKASALFHALAHSPARIHKKSLHRPWWR